MFVRNVVRAGMVALGLAGLPISGAQAGDFYHDPVLSSALTAPSGFDGIYAGVSFGLMNSNRQVFYANGYRIPAGVFVGYNAQVTPFMFAGIEGQFDATYHWEDGAFGTNAFALARLGFLTSADFSVYEMAGLGLIDGRSAYALGVGAEQRVAGNFSLRAEALSFGQLAPPAGVTNYHGVMGMKIMLGGLWYLNQDVPGSVGPSPSSPEPTRFNGRYLGLYAGGGYNPAHNFFGGDAFYGWHITRFFTGGIAGWNTELGSMFRAGGEFQAGINYNTSGQIGADAQVLGRVGIVPMDAVMAYASGGVGLIEAVPAYSLGGGVEYALWGQNTVRADFQALGQFNPGPPYTVSGFSAARFTLGTLWHLD